MSRRVVVVGCGYTGMEIVHQAAAMGWEVVGSTRSEETAEHLRHRRAQPLIWDVIHSPIEELEAVLAPETAVVYSIPTLFKTYEPAEEGELPRHVAPVERVLRACIRKQVDRFIYLSSTAVYGDHHGEWVDEDAERRPESPYGKMRMEIEDHVLKRGKHINVNVARIVGIYGPGRTLVDYMQRGGYVLVNGGRKVTNRIHVEDLARSVVAMIRRAPEGARVYNVSDGHPTTVAELVEFVCNRMGIERPPEMSLEEFAENKKDPNVIARWKSSIRVKNDRLINELGLMLSYPDVFAGYKALLGDIATGGEAER